MDWLTGLFSDPDTAPAAYGLTGLVVLLVLVFAFTRLRHMRRGMFIAGGRKHRLAVLDATAIDNRRRLVLVRRDDVEHLLLIGGSNDVVVETGLAADKSVSEVSSGDDAKAAAAGPDRAEPVSARRTERPNATEPAPEAPDPRPSTARPAPQPAQATGDAAPEPRRDEPVKQPRTDHRVEPRLDPAAASPSQPASRPDPLLEPDMRRTEPGFRTQARPAPAPQPVPAVQTTAPAPANAARRPSPDAGPATDDTLDSEMDKLLDGLLDTPANER